jgi:hypothetical protein
LNEAQRIHNENMRMATRLETVRPNFLKSDLRKAPDIRPKKPKTTTTKKRKNRGQTAPNLTSRSDANGSSDYNKAMPNSARLLYSDNNMNSNSNMNNNPSSNVLLEYTKLQDGRVLDVVVIKEPFRDRFAIFGIDVADKQRYDLRLSSEDVSSILDGDILVTSLDNVEV